MANPLLSQIANPQVANIPGAILAGRQAAQQQQQFQVGQQLAGQQLQMGEQKIAANERAAQAQNITAIAHDIFAATASEGENQEKMLQLALSKAPEGSREAIAVNELLSTPAGPDRDQKLIESIIDFQNLGILPKPEKTESDKFRPKQKTGSFLVKDPETGQTSIVTGVFDPTDGTLKTSSATIDSGDVVSKLGETAKEQTKRKVEEASKTTQVKQKEKRTGDLIERGVLAAESTATIRRAINLLETVKTGGVNAISLAIKSKLGIEGADEGELSNSLGKAVLSQLKETFGAQFTVEEGKRLERIEASFGKSLETNKRLLAQTLAIAERTAKRARKAAKSIGDDSTVTDIDDLLSFNLSVDKDTQPAIEKPQTGQPPVVTSQAQFDQLPSGAIFIEDGVQYRKP